MFLSTQETTIFSGKTMIRWKDRMMISIGHKNFLESSYIEEILTPNGSQAARCKREAAEGGMLISATEGRRAKSMIKLKTKHIVLSALEPETLRSKLMRVRSSPVPADDYDASQPIEKNMQKSHSEFRPAGERRWGPEHPAFPWASCDEPDRRCGIERRRFSYTCHIPERRSGEDRRKSLSLDSPLSE
jgi:extracellular matrix regulatory protein A